MEIISFLAQAVDEPIGRNPVPGWFNVNIDLQTAGGLIDGPGLRANHSYEFHHDVVKTWRFYQQIRNNVNFTSDFP